MKQELQKLQQESRMGQKGKDVAAKDLEAARKKLQDVEAKLKVAVSDKQAALQVGQGLCWAPYCKSLPCFLLLVAP